MNCIQTCTDAVCIKECSDKPKRSSMAAFEQLVQLVACMHACTHACMHACVLCTYVCVRVRACARALVRPGVVRRGVGSTGERVRWVGEREIPVVVTHRLLLPTRTHHSYTTHTESLRGGGGGVLGKERGGWVRGRS